MDVSIILPCRNEEKTLGKCIIQIKSVFKKENIKGEIIVSDSSNDKSPSIARKHKAVLIKHNKKGYGNAILEALDKASGKYIIIGDADGTYNYKEIPLLLEKIKRYDFVIGSRLKGNIKKGAMPFTHQYLGNPLLSLILNLFFNTKISDAHSGFRAIRKNAFNKLNLQTTGMEFASEMIIRAAKNGLKITEVPITYYPRIGKSKLKTVSDGWRHLRFMLMFSPTHLFLIPGILIFIFGLLVLILTSTQYKIIGAFTSILGYQVINLGLYSKIYAIHTGFEKHDKLIDIIAEKIPLEKGIMLGIIILIISGISLIKLQLPGMIIALTIFILGIQTIFSVFFISIMLVEKR